MEINFKEIMNWFFLMPLPNALGWRSENDYVYEYIEYLRDRYGIVFPDHTILVTRGNIDKMRKECRLIFTKGDVNIFRSLYNRDEFKIVGIGYKELSSIKEEYKNEWGV